jgi:hypothetical protein
LCMITKTLHTLALASAFPTFSSSSISLTDTSDNASSGQSKNLPTHPRKFSKTYTTYTQYQLHSIFFQKKNFKKNFPFMDDWWTEFILSGFCLWRHEVSQKSVCVCVCVCFWLCSHTSQ